MFRPEDMNALRAIRILVHERGMTLKGAKTILAEQCIEAVLGGTATLGAGPRDIIGPARELQATVARAFAAPDCTTRLADALRELADIKQRIDAVRARRIA
jgi:hypothetical protein